MAPQELEVIAETEDWIAVDKPMGALSVPSRMGREDARPCVLYALSARYGRQFYPVHRLDEEVSGILVFAKTANEHRRLNGLFEAREVEKEYEAFCEVAPGFAAPAIGAPQRFEDKLARGKKRAFVAEHGKPSLTDAVVVGAVRDAGLAAGLLRWSLLPRTGRSHQLRVQLARRGFPIAGDALYGARSAFPAGGIALRAVRLVFPAVSGPPIELRALDLTRLIARRESGLRP